jgi:hypothetical protein
LLKYTYKNPLYLYAGAKCGGLSFSLNAFKGWKYYNFIWRDGWHWDS